GEIEGTMLYQRLLLQAKNSYLSSLKKDSNGNMNPGLRVRRLLETLSINYEEMKEAENWLRPPDDDSWMEITPEALDSILEKMSQKPNEANVTKVITDGLKSFVHHRSDIEGIEVSESSQKSKKQKINFDPDAFADAMNTILDFRIPGSDDEKSSSSMSGYSDDDDDDISLDEQKQVSKNNISGECGKVLNKMKAYMDQMDKELSKTDVGLSFERLPPAPAKNVQVEETLSDINDEEDDFQPVDVDLTALKNILESYSNQQGMPGPASNLFSTMGIQILDDLDS
ncbi:protein ecdysoneless homolog, partial [Stegodyphus dumicola]|uniref:protein ecdysoneless homolog n=1 Tax=Stegodyphus dumicola TaxID=202533 RepID=UPI0015B18198